jgi:hypothetical protein
MHQIGTGRKLWKSTPHVEFWAFFLTNDGEEKAQNGEEKIHRPQGEGRKAGFR